MERRITRDSTRRAGMGSSAMRGVMDWDRRGRMRLRENEPFL